MTHSFLQFWSSSHNNTFYYWKNTKKEPPSDINHFFTLENWRTLEFCGLKWILLCIKIVCSGLFFIKNGVVKAWTLLCMTWEALSHKALMEIGNAAFDIMMSISTSASCDNASYDIHNVFLLKSCFKKTETSFLNNLSKIAALMCKPPQKLTLDTCFQERIIQI